MGMNISQNARHLGPPLLECVQLHLQTFFRTDAVEQEWFYISNGLKKLNRVPIRDFVQRIQHLNRYLELLPCLLYSLKAAKSMKVCGSFDDAYLASHILRMVPWNWQDQYEFSGALVPQSVREHLEVLEYQAGLHNQEGWRRT